MFLYFILGISLATNMFTIFTIIYGYKYIKNNLFVPKAEGEKPNFRKMFQMIDDFYNDEGE